MIKITYIFLTLTIFIFQGMSEAGAEAKRLSVVELFTSQGCSSCPPADMFLGELAMRSDVLALAYHVDYWDYIGWDDVFAKPQFTQRQRTYAQKFDLRYIYTPQMVVAGKVENSGTKRRPIIKAIENDLAQSSTLSLDVQPNNITLKGDITKGSANVYRVSFHKEVKTDVRRGENRGKTLTDYHVVDDLSLLGPWQGGVTEFDLAQNDLDPELGHAIFIQLKDDLRILGAFYLN